MKRTVGYQCKECEDVFVRRYLIQNHIKSYHLSPNGYKSKRFKAQPYNSSSVQQNKSQLNLKRRQNKIFSDKPVVDLNVISKQKTDTVFKDVKSVTKKLKKLICDRNECKRSFNNIAELNSHIKRVHSRISHQTIYICDRLGCESSFKTEFAFNSHRRNHTTDLSSPLKTSNI
jgi:hypothetical protein